MKTLGMFITMSFLINETGQAKDLQDLTLANDTITESIIQAGGQKKALPADTAYRKKTTDIVKAKIAQAQQSSRISPAVKDFQALLYNFRWRSPTPVYPMQTADYKAYCPHSLCRSRWHIQGSLP